MTATEEYGLRCLLVLAGGSPAQQMSIADIADREGISVPYASKLLSMLRRGKLVNAERGRNGGFSLAREASKISLYEVVLVLGGPLLDPDHCSKRAGQLAQCVHEGNCSVHDILGGLAGYVAKFLSETTLQDVLDGSNIGPVQQIDTSGAMLRTKA